MKETKLTKRILSVVLVVCMLMAYAVPSNAVGVKALEFEQVDNSVLTNPSAQRDPVNFEDDTPTYDDDEVIRVSIVLEDKSTIAAGYSTEDIVTNEAAMKYRDMLKGIQEKLIARISEKLGFDLDVVWTLTLAANMISANVAYGELEEIKEISGVADVVIETRYEPAEVSSGEDGPNMAIATGMTGTNQVWQAGYTGAGSRVAIIDTGLDIDHEAFDNGAFLAALAEDALVNGQLPDLLGTSEISDVLDELNAAARYEGLSSEDLYISEKIPFGFNYVDSDLDVTHLNDLQGEHGSHVAGIATANRYTRECIEITPAMEDTYVVGNAPDAQVLVMKVFGKGGGAYDSDYMAAIEDAIVLGCDSVNLSLGSASPGMTTSAQYQQILDELAESDTVVVMSAGNSGYWAETTPYGVPYSDDVNFQTAGSPGTFTNALTVASVDNDGSIAPYFMAGDQVYTYVESTGYSNAPLGSLAADGDVELEYVFVDGVGVESDYEGIDLTGKAVFCSRGTTSFFEKGNVAAAAGAAAIFICNNQPGTIMMDLTGYTYTAPCVSITQADAAAIKANSQAQTTESGVTYYTGTVTITDAIAVMQENADAYTMSTFSSWGTPGDLSIKPEITAPGGNIYSVAGQYNTGSGYAGGHDQYELMSGTSMAAPQITGMTAVLKQYIEDQELSQAGLTDRALAQSLLMSTATPMRATEGYIYSVLQQGAGLANLLNATQAGVYVLMGDDATDSAADGKVKAELGDDPNRTGTYSFSFTLNNLVGVEQEYALSADVFVQDLIEQGLLGTYTAQIGADVTFVVDGVELNPGDLTGYDFNADGLVNDLDAQTLMDHVVLGTALKGDQENADVDRDGDVDTHDVYILMTLLGSGSVTVPAEGSVDVQVIITLTESTKSYLDTYYPNGTYIEAYVNADALPTEEGVQYADHSIPVLAFYGGWTESSMFDKGSVLDYSYDQEGMETRVPYLYYENYLYGFSNYFGVTFQGSADEYVFGGNLYALEDVYMPERNAMNSTNGDMISSVNYTLIRNAADLMVTVTDVETGEMYMGGSLGSAYGAYYHANSGAWQNTRGGITFGWAGTDAEGNPLPEGTTVEIALTAVPEYYYNDDGKVNSDRAATLGDGASYTIQLTIDNTAPTLEEVLMDEESGALSVVASDNRYLAAVQVYAQDGDVTEPLAMVAANATEPGQTVEIPLGEGLEADVYLIQVVDYAGNVTTYRAFLNTEETDAVESVAISDEVLSLVKNNSIYLEAKAMPVTLSDRSVTWSSSDETIATVDADGKVTAVGVGQCVITATAVLDETKTASCAIEVIEINADLNGVIWDENGEVWFSQFNTTQLPDYTKLTEESVNLELASVAYGADGKLFAATMDSTNLVSSYYEVDPATFETTKIGDSSIGYMDLAYAPNVMGGVMMATYDPYVVLIDSATGDYLGAFEWSSSTLVGIAYAGSVYNTNYEEYVDVFYLLDSNGNLYQDGFMNYQGSVANFYGEVDGLMGNTGLATDLDMFQSMYYNGEYLFVSNFVYTENYVGLYAIDIDNTGGVFYMGQFADGVWPVGGLFELNAGEVEVSEEAAVQLAGAQVKAESAFSTEKIQPVELSAPKKAEAPVAGSLNATSPESSPAMPMSIEQSSEDLFTVYVFAKNGQGTWVDTHNGLVSVDWDAEGLTLVDYWVNGDVSAELAEDGSFKFGYARLDTINAYEEPIAALQFQAKDLEAMINASVSITHHQVNNEHIDYTEVLAHEFEDVVTEPTCTEGGYTTHICGNCRWSYVDTYTDPTGHVFGEWVVTVEPTCTEPGVQTRTCTNEGCTAAESEAVEALGHDYEAVVTPPTETEQGYTTHTCTRCGDSYVDDIVDPVKPEDPTDPGETEPGETEPGETEPGETEPQETTKPTAPAEPVDPDNSQTGDSFQLGLWAALLLASLAGALILLFKGRKWMRF